MTFSFESMNFLQAGQGTYYWSDGSTYVGQFEDGHFHGHGVMIYAAHKSVDRFDGEWRKGKRNGRGIELFKSGAKYDGQVSHCFFKSPPLKKYNYLANDK
jgi:hypothetical protein